MEWFDVAVTIEEEGEKFYRDLAGRSETAGMQKIFTMLADDEVKHKRRFEAMKRSIFHEEPESQTHKKAKEIFKASKKEHMLSEQKHLDVYSQALGIEQKSIDFYQEKLKSVKEESFRISLEQIIKEEKFHYQMIETIVTMVERPESWVEDPEFGVREDY